MKAHCKKIHLCDSCIHSYPACDAEEIEFGDGKGNDNVIECNKYNQRDMEYSGFGDGYGCGNYCPCCEAKMDKDELFGKTEQVDEQVEDNE